VTPAVPAWQRESCRVGESGYELRLGRDEPRPFDVAGVTVYPGNWSPENWTTDAQSGVPSAATVTELSLSAGVTVA
jgi:hypothetical protein